MPKIKTIFSILLFILAFIYFYFDNNSIEVTKYEIVDDDIPESFNNFKIAHISDLHNKNFRGKLETLVSQNKPNIIIITGDAIDSIFPNYQTTYNQIKELLKIAPVYYVSGNHEKGLGYNYIRQSLVSLGVIVLDNKSEDIVINDESITISGVSDYTFHKNMDWALVNTMNNKNNYNILLSHQPKFFDKYKKYGADLIFSGHEHGGQIRIPFIGAFYSSHQGFFPKLTDGKKTDGDSTIIISRGLGNSGRFPLRLFNRPELIITTLSHK